MGTCDSSQLKVPEFTLTVLCNSRTGGLPDLVGGGSLAAAKSSLAAAVDDGRTESLEAFSFG